MAEGLSSVRNAARILKQFSAANPEYGVSELARKLELSKSTAHRLLSTLRSEGLLDQDADSGKYRLGLAMYDLGTSVRSRIDLHEAVIPPMEVLRNRIGETVHVAVLDQREVVYVERLDSPHGLRRFLEIGRRMPASATATGKCLLAYLPDPERDSILDGWELTALTDGSITSMDVLQTQLKEIRRQGFAENWSESDHYVYSVAAPIRGRSGSIVASISAAGPLDRMEPKRLKATQAVQEAGAQASRRLGYG